MTHVKKLLQLMATDNSPQVASQKNRKESA